MTNHQEDFDEPTLGEVYRAVLRVEQLQKETNGTVRRHEKRLTRLETISSVAGGVLSAAFGWLASRQ